MTEKRYTITLGKNNEFKEIIDHSKQDKHISMFEFLKQVEEQEKAFKKLKKKNKELKEENEQLRHDATILIQSNQDYRRENEQLKEIINQCFNVITESDFAKKEYCNGLLRLLGEENDVNKAKQRIKEFLE